MLHSDINLSIAEYLSKYPDDVVLGSEWRRCVDQVIRTCLPIIGEDEKGKPHCYGSGFVLSKNDRFFLFTAAHVLDLRKQLVLGVHDGDSPLSIDDLTSTINITKGTARARNKDHYDLGFFEIRKEVVEKLINLGIRVILSSESQLDQSPQLKDRMIVGYPSKRQRFYSDTIHSKPIWLGSDSLGSNDVESLGLNCNHHWASAWINPVDYLTGQSAAGLEVGGMSGGPVWSLPTVGDWVAHGIRPRFAGMFVGAIRKNFYGPNSLILWAQLAKVYPELAYTMRPILVQNIPALDKIGRRPPKYLFTAETNETYPS